MSNLVYDALLRHASSDRKFTPGGWVSFNGPCCLYNNQPRPDTRKRAGVRMGQDGSVVYNCFNCNYSAGWAPGRNLSQRMANVLEWMSMPSDELKKLNFKIWQIREAYKADETTLARHFTKLEFKPRDLPPGARPLLDWIKEGCTDPDFLHVVEYLGNRGEDLLGATTYYWTPSKINNWNRRLIIPFLWNGEIVGNTARATFETKWRYFTDGPKDFLFNTQVTKQGWKYLFINEGPFDALANNGIATLGDHLNQDQISWINQTGLTPVVVPDRMNEGGVLVDTALKEGWSVSFPRWDKGIKDSADAVRRYGRLYTTWSIIDARTDNRLQINIERKRLK